MKRSAWVSAAVGTALACVMLCARAASGEFSAAEKAEALNQVEAIYESSYGTYWTARHLLTRPQDAAQIENVLNLLVTAKENHLLGLLYLLDQEGAAAGNTIGAMTRAQSRQAGINAILGSPASYASTLAAIDAMVSTSSLATARSQIAWANGARLNLNTTLAYTEPRMTENLAMPGATRDQSANAGPHGDYRRSGDMIRSFELLSNNWIRLTGTLMAQNSASIMPLLDLVGVATPMQRVGRFNAVIAGLLVGVEHPEYVDELNADFASGTTQRSRHFFRMLLVDELTLGWDHLPPHDTLASGRGVERGLSYELNVACDRVANFLNSQTALPAYARTGALLMKNVCVSWSPLDSIALNTLVLRYFSNVGPPGQVVGVCGANTTLQPGPPPTCVGTGGGGGCPAGQSCQPPCPTCPACPTFHAELTSILELDRVEYKALCVPNP